MDIKQVTQANVLLGNIETTESKIAAWKRVEFTPREGRMGEDCVVLPSSGLTKMMVNELSAKAVGNLEQELASYKLELNEL